MGFGKRKPVGNALRGVEPVGWPAAFCYGYTFRIYHLTRFSGRPLGQAAPLALLVRREKPWAVPSHRRERDDKLEGLVRAQERFYAQRFYLPGLQGKYRHS